VAATLIRDDETLIVMQQIGDNFSFFRRHVLDVSFSVLSFASVPMVVDDPLMNWKEGIRCAPEAEDHQSRTEHTDEKGRNRHPVGQRRYPSRLRRFASAVLMLLGKYHDGRT
jgi:hypothetical protein